MLSPNHITFNKMPIFVAIFFMLFLVTISFSALLITHDISVSAAIVILIIFVLSLILSKKIKNIPAIILLLIVALISHTLSLYLLLPVGCLGDQRVFFINSIVNTGKIETLEKYQYENIYYTRYPIPWLAASSVSLILMISPQASWLITGSAAYLCFIASLMLVCTYFLKTRSLEGIAWIIITIMTTVYLHRPFQDLIPSSIGMLSLVMALYLFFSRKKFASILLLLIIPLLIAHGLSIYFTTLSLLLSALSGIVTSAPRREVQRAINFAVIVFAGSWFYQVGVQLIDSIVREIPYRWNQLLNVITSPVLERPMTSSVTEQELHAVYWFDKIITPLAYSLPAILTMIGTVYFFYKTLRKRHTHDTILMLLSLTCSLMFLIAGVFAWKGIENAIARYFYVYAAPISVLINSSLLYCTFRTNHSPIFRYLFLIVVSIIGVLALTESFYTPYASLMTIPDNLKFERMYEKFYGGFERLSYSSLGHIMRLKARANEITYVTLHTDILSDSLRNCIYNNGLKVVLIRG